MGGDLHVSVRPDRRPFPDFRHHLARDGQGADRRRHGHPAQGGPDHHRIRSNLGPHPHRALRLHRDVPDRTVFRAQGDLLSDHRLGATGEFSQQDRTVQANQGQSEGTRQQDIGLVCMRPNRHRPEPLDRRARAFADVVQPVRMWARTQHGIHDAPVTDMGDCGGDPYDSASGTRKTDHFQLRMAPGIDLQAAGAQARQSGATRHIGVNMGLDLNHGHPGAQRTDERAHEPSCKGIEIQVGPGIQIQRLRLDDHALADDRRRAGCDGRRAAVPVDEIIRDCRVSASGRQRRKIVGPVNQLVPDAARLRRVQGENHRLVGHRILIRIRQPDPRGVVFVDDSKIDPAFLQPADGRAAACRVIHRIPGPHGGAVGQPDPVMGGFHLAEGARVELHDRVPVQHVAHPLRDAGLDGRDHVLVAGKQSPALLAIRSVLVVEGPADRKYENSARQTAGPRRCPGIGMTHDVPVRMGLDLDRPARAELRCAGDRSDRVAAHQRDVHAGAKCNALARDGTGTGERQEVQPVVRPHLDRLPGMRLIRRGPLVDSRMGDDRRRVGIDMQHVDRTDQAEEIAAAHAQGEHVDVFGRIRPHADAACRIAHRSARDHVAPLTQGIHRRTIRNVGAGLLVEHRHGHRTATACDSKTGAQRAGAIGDEGVVPCMHDDMAARPDLSLALDSRLGQGVDHQYRDRAGNGHFPRHGKAARNPHQVGPGRRLHPHVPARVDLGETGSGDPGRLAPDEGLRLSLQDQRQQGWRHRRLAAASHPHRHRNQGVVPAGGHHHILSVRRAGVVLVDLRAGINDGAGVDRVHVDGSGHGRAEAARESGARPDRKHLVAAGCDHHDPALQDPVAFALADRRTVPDHAAREHPLRRLQHVPLRGTSQRYAEVQRDSGSCVFPTRRQLERVVADPNHVVAPAQAQAPQRIGFIEVEHLLPGLKPMVRMRDLVVRRIQVRSLERHRLCRCRRVRADQQVWRVRAQGTPRKVNGGAGQRVAPADCQPDRVGIHPDHVIPGIPAEPAQQALRRVEHLVAGREAMIGQGDLVLARVHVLGQETERRDEAVAERQHTGPLAQTGDLRIFGDPGLRGLVDDAHTRRHAH